jgi:hypothetical protein
MRLALRWGVFALSWALALGQWLTRWDMLTLAVAGVPVHCVVGALMLADALDGLLSPDRWRVPEALRQAARRPLPAARRQKENRAMGWALVVWAVLLGTGASLVEIGIIPRILVLPAVAMLLMVDQFFILRWCPFAAWITHTRCCRTCPLHDWGEAMVFSPLIVLPLLSAAFVLLSLPVLVNRATEPAGMAPEKKLFAYSIIYLFAIFGALVFDRWLLA